MNAVRGIVLTLPILERMRPIEGWLSDAEADILISGAWHALSDQPESAVVEVGSYVGRSTVVLGSVVKAIRPETQMFAIDPHDGDVSWGSDGEPVRTIPTLEAFRHTLTETNLEDVVVTIQKRSWEVNWERPIGFLFIDGLHDRLNVARDFAHFEPWLQDGSLVAFHDYADGWPDVREVVDELESSGRLERVARADALVLLRHGSPLPTR